MTAVDPEKLEKALAAFPSPCGPLAVIMEAARAHLSTIPRVKEVEVWHVEWTDNGSPTSEWKARLSGPFLSVANADACAAGLSACKTVGCVRVVGPHKHQVPA